MGSNFLKIFVKFFDVKTHTHTHTYFFANAEEHEVRIKWVTQK